MDPNVSMAEQTNKKTRISPLEVEAPPEPPKAAEKPRPPVVPVEEALKR